MGNLKKKKKGIHVSKTPVHLIAAHQSFLQLLMQVDDLLRATQPPARTHTCAGGEGSG